MMRAPLLPSPLRQPFLPSEEGGGAVRLSTASVAGESVRMSSLQHCSDVTG